MRVSEQQQQQQLRRCQTLRPARGLSVAFGTSCSVREGRGEGGVADNPPQPQLILAALRLITTGQMFDTLSPNHTQHSVTICFLNSFQGDVKPRRRSSQPRSLLGLIVSPSLSLSLSIPPPCFSPPPSFLSSRLLGCLLLSARLCNECHSDHFRRGLVFFFFFARLLDPGHVSRCLRRCICKNKDQLWK